MFTKLIVVFGTQLNQKITAGATYIVPGCGHSKRTFF